MLIPTAVVAPMPRVKARRTLEEVIMGGVRTTKAAALLVLVAGVLLVAALTPASALAAWGDTQANVVDSLGTGVVPFLNVSVANHASNDTSYVTTVQFSDDGQSWYAEPYTGQPCDWVLGGESGHKQLFVRFGAADGSVSPVLTAAIDVDTAGPVTRARSARLASGGRTALQYSVRDAGSPRVDAVLVVKGKGGTLRVDLGRVQTGGHRALVRLGLRAGTYTWHVEATDLAGRDQVRHTAARLVIR
jgi:hypothetical protein